MNNFILSFRMMNRMSLWSIPDEIMIMERDIVFTIYSQ